MAHKKLGSKSTCGDVAEAFPETAGQIKGSTVIVTGGSAGIGEETAFQFALLGGNVVLACRNQEKAEKAKAKMVARAGEKEVSIHCMPLELSDLDSVRSFVAAFKERVSAEGWKLKYLICNAGMLPSKVAESKQGYELAFATNHLGHFALTEGLLPELRTNAPSRVVVVASVSHYGPVNVSSEDLLDAEVVKSKLVYRKYKSMGLITSNKLYGNTKLCNVLMAKEFASREKDNGVTFASLHPGTMITTTIVRDQGLLARGFFKAISPFTKNVNQGSSTTFFCALAPADTVNGKYADNCNIKEESRRASKEAASVLFEVSAELIKQKQ